MSLSQLTDKIIKEAELKKISIINGAKNYAEKKEIETMSLSKSKQETFEMELEKKLSQNTEKVLRHAEKEVKTRIEKTKRGILNSIFTETLEQLQNASDEQYEKIISSLFESLPQTIDGTLLVKPKHISIVKKVLKKKNISCEIKEDATVKEGFVIKGKAFEYNGTFEKLLQEKKKQLEVEVAHILFNE